MTTLQRLTGMLLQEQRAAFLEALRDAPQEARPEDAAYLALRKIGMTQRQAGRMITVARAQTGRAGGRVLR